MEFNFDAQPDVLPHQSTYKLLTGSILPRPIGWISTIDEAGRYNLAPFSFFNVVCPQPPTILFCPSFRNTDGSPKDTLRNVRATGEFVANIVTEPLAEAMNLSSAELPPDIDEFAYAGLTPVPATVVRAPRVAESPVHFECRVHQIIDISDQPGGGSIVIGRVVLIHVRDDVLTGEDKIDLAALKPIGRLAGTGYCRVTDLFDLTRPPSQIK
ncbi:MAG: flavin reductase family protein [bacterium]|nr:flavin reductase family protein [bacterium]